MIEFFKQSPDLKPDTKFKNIRIQNERTEIVDTFLKLTVEDLAEYLLGKLSDTSITYHPEHKYLAFLPESGNSYEREQKALLRVIAAEQGENPEIYITYKPKAPESITKSPTEKLTMYVPLWDYTTCIAIGCLEGICSDAGFRTLPGKLMIPTILAAAYLLEPDLDVYKAACLLIEKTAGYKKKSFIQAFPIILELSATENTKNQKGNE